MIFVGDDWAEAHHDVHVMTETGRRLAVKRSGEGLDGIGGLHADGRARGGSGRGGGGDRDGSGLVGACVDGGGVSGARHQPVGGVAVSGPSPPGGRKSDAGDAKLLADLVRTDRHNHRPVGGDDPARHATAPLSVWSSNKPRHRLSRTGNRQLNAAISASRSPGSAAPRRPGLPRRPRRPARQQPPTSTARPQPATARHRLPTFLAGTRATPAACLDEAA